MPLDDENLLLEIHIISKPNEQEHKLTDKIKLKGSRRTEIQTKLKTQTALMTQLELVNKHGGFNKKEVYSLPVLRKAKAEINKRLLKHPDELKALRILNRSVENFEVIKELRIFPHYINIFWTKLQEETAKNSQGCILSIDATHGICRSPTAGEKHLYEKNNKEKPLFYYCAVLTDPNSSPPRSTPITQMIAQSHTAATIGLWLSSFVASSKLKIIEATSDCSYPILNAMSKEFNNISFEEYVSSINTFLRSSSKTLPKTIKTLIRLDRHHVVNIFCKWKLWRSTGSHIRYMCIKILCLTIIYDAFKAEKGLFLDVLNGVMNNSAKDKELQGKILKLVEGQSFCKRSKNEVNCSAPFESIVRRLYPTHTRRSTFLCCPDKWDVYLELNCSSNNDLISLEKRLNEQLINGVKCFCMKKEIGESALSKILVLESFMWSKDLCNSVLAICLSKIPRNMIIQGLRYILSFVVAYIGNGDNMGHYNTYYRSSDCEFTMLDDLQEIPVLKVSQKIIQPVFMFYVIN